MHPAALTSIVTIIIDSGTDTMILSPGTKCQIPLRRSVNGWYGEYLFKP